MKYLAIDPSGTGTTGVSCVSDQPFKIKVEGAEVERNYYFVEFQDKE
jgi:hypothetical protein